jgi:hypothetical protein
LIHGFAVSFFAFSQVMIDGRLWTYVTSMQHCIDIQL